MIEENIVQAYKTNLKANWIDCRKEVACIEYKTCLATGDEQFINLYANVVFTIKSLKITKKS